MNLNVVGLLIACSIHICILQKTVGNSSQVDVESENQVNDVTEGIELDEFDMSYLECTNDGCKLVNGSVKELPKQAPWVLELQSPRTRSKRRMFLPDNRLRMRAKSVGRFPFNSAVAIRVNGEVKCSGVAILKPRFFLTAAHCVQPGDKKKDVEVGVLYKYQKMQWVKVNRSRFHSFWKKGKATVSKRNLRLKDYAVLETETPLDASPLPIGYVGTDEYGNEILQINKTFIYFSAYDDDRRPDTLNLRFCQVKKIKYTRIYSKCDTVPKTAGAGVYVRMRNKETGNVDRKVIAIATGDYGVKVGLEYSVALRINSRMFAHICYIVTGGYNNCN